MGVNVVIVLGVGMGVDICARVGMRVWLLVQVLAVVWEGGDTSGVGIAVHSCGYGWGNYWRGLGWWEHGYGSDYMCQESVW